VKQCLSRNLAFFTVSKKEVDRPGQDISTYIMVRLHRILLPEQQNMRREMLRKDTFSENVAES
jgi:hypothetical protein